VKAHRAALEALFAPKQDLPPPSPTKRESAKMVQARETERGPRDEERTKLLARLLAAEGRDEARVQGALSVLAKLLDNEAPKRRTVLDARLRRLEDTAEDPATREQTSALRKRLSGR
jgi:hypothetical protein